MSLVIGIRFKKAGKIYNFEANNIDIKKGIEVIVETSRGVEFGKVVVERQDINDDELVLPLKKILRVATPDDRLKNEENKYKQKDAFSICAKKIKEHSLDMKLIEAEYTFDNNKVIFYFTSDDRVDFRDLVKDLAAIFKTRIELRQIGVRDEAKFINGIAQCGQPLCCANWLSDFQPVSIKMAKDQNLSLSPTKISGVCGRLMCCLKYEHDLYIDSKQNLPKIGEIVMSDSGKCKVIAINILEEKIKVLINFSCDEENKNKDPEWLTKEEYKKIRGNA